MASITTANSGSKRALFYDETKTRRTVYLGRVSDKEAETIRRRIEGILSSKILGSPMAQDDAAWLAKSPALREKLIAVGLVEPEPIPEKVIIPTLDAFLDGYIKRHGKSRKPATVAVWKQVVANLKEYMPEGIRINQITAGHAKEFHEKLKACVTRVRRDFGPLVQNAGQAQGKHGSDPLASQLARKIRERLIRHCISHRVGRNASWDCLSSPGLCMPF